jgi:predicted HAD superfamily Cof-like phosphohydrolase
MTHKHLKQAIEFRRIFGQPFAKTNHKFPESEEICEKLKMQLSLIQEEGNEFNEALEIWQRMSLVSRGEASPESLYTYKSEVLKELSDLVYVCYQMAAFLGFDLDEALDRIHQSNLSKLDDNGQPIYNEHGKVMKGPNYKKPDLLDLVRESAIGLKFSARVDGLDWPETLGDFTLVGPVNNTGSWRWYERTFELNGVQTTERVMVDSGLNFIQSSLA